MIHLRCQCGQELHAYPLDRGKIMRCAKCGLSLRIPRDAVDDEAGEYEISKIEDQSPKLNAETAAIPMAEVAAPKIGRCPKCGAVTHLGQTICVECGIDFWTGKTARVIPARYTGAQEPLEWNLREFGKQMVSSFAYPLKDIGLLVAVNLVVIILAGIGATGYLLISPIFALGVSAVTALYFGAYAVGIVQSTLVGYDEPPNMPGPSTEALVIPLLWLGTLAAVFCGPPIGLTIGTLYVPWLKTAAIIAWALGFVFLPMSILIVSGAGDVSLRGLKGVVASALRNAHVYSIYFAVALVLAGAAAVCVALLYAPVTGDVSGAIALFVLIVGAFGRTLLSYMILVYLLAATARMLGIMGRYREKTLDFGEGASEPGLNRALGSVILGAWVAGLSAALYFVSEALAH